MRHALASLVLALFLFPSLALGETVKYEDLVKRPKWTDLYYKKFTDVPFTGKVTGVYQGSLKDGKKYGSWLHYHGNGQLWSKRTYQDGKEEGTSVSYYEDGQIMYKGTFKDDMKDGPWVYNYDDLTVNEKRTGTFKDGVKISDTVPPSFLKQ